MRSSGTRFDPILNFGLPVLIFAALMGAVVVGAYRHAGYLGGRRPADVAAVEERVVELERRLDICGSAAVG